MKQKPTSWIVYPYTVFADKLIHVAIVKVRLNPPHSATLEMAEPIPTSNWRFASPGSAFGEARKAGVRKMTATNIATVTIDDHGVRELAERLFERFGDEREAFSVDGRSVGYGALALCLAVVPGWVPWIAGTVAILALYRAGSFIHELAHIKKGDLPNFRLMWNVLIGDMSLVGPRPSVPSEVAKYSPYERCRLRVKPGITCLWQISGRSEIDFHEWMKLDLHYIDNWSLSLDLKILLYTLPAVLFGKGAR